MNIIKKASLLVIIILSLSSTMSHAAFDTLRELQDYAIKYQEYPPGNIDWFNPNYSTYHEKITKMGVSILRYFFDKFDVAQMLQTKLNNYLKRLKTSDITETKIVRINSDQAQVFVWGDTHAAFHSLVRCMAWLYEQKVINEKLEIIKPDHYFIFNGDAISRSAYNMEALILILSLLEKNPDKVFYICGNHEYKSYWRNFALKQELRIRAKHLVSEDVPLGKEIDTFFATLPFAVYLNNSNNPANVIRISHFSRSESTIDEQEFGTFLTDTKKGISYYDANKKEKSPQYIDVAALVTSEDWKELDLVKEGLTLLEQDLGSITWGVFSSPTEVYQKYTNFFYDSFALIKVDTPIEKSTITLINRDVRTKDDFTIHDSRNIMSGMPSKDPKSFSGKPALLFGASMSLVQGVPIMGKMVKQGLMTRINKENSEQGGVNGQVIRVMVKNDDYNPSLTRKNIKYFIDHGIDITLLQVGTPTLTSYLDLIREGKLIALFPITGSPYFYTQDMNRIINYRASYTDEVIALINYIYTEKGARSFAFFYQNDSYGISPLETAHKTLNLLNAAHQSTEQLSIKKSTDVSYARGGINLKEQAAKLQESQSDTIGFFSAAQPTQELLRQMGIEQIVNKDLFGISFLGEESFRQFLKKHGIPFTFGAVVPNPYISKIEIVEDYRKDMSKNSYSYNVFSLEAYIATTIFIKTLNMLNGQITQDAILSTIKSFKDVELKGLTLTYNPTRCDLAKYVYLETSDNREWIRKEINTLN